tara:strand:- start:616 stop:945 length:330 start_codon:yes stop_codon:yes gene_type:complete
MGDKIYNKNAREAHLMAEAYDNIYKDEDAEYDSEAAAYRDMSDKYKAEDHVKGVKMALEALEMFKDELHIEGHPEDINVNEVADALKQLVGALTIIFDPEDMDYITSGK